MIWRTAWLLMLACLLGSAALGQKPPEEEEDPKRVKPKVTLRVDDDTVAPPGGVAIDLKKAAEQARHAAVRDLFKNLAVPHDRVTFPATGRVDQVAPLPLWFDPKQSADEPLLLQPLDGKAFKTSSKKVAKVEHYEAVSIRLVDEFLTAQDDIPRLEKLAEAEKALNEAIRFHASARQRGIRKGKVGWDDLDQRLRTRLLDLRLEQLDELMQARQWAEAEELAAILADVYPSQPRFLSALVRLRVRQIENGLQDDKLDSYIVARRTLDELQRLFPRADQDEPVQKLRERLRLKAVALLKTVDALPEPKKQDQLRAIENIWPELPGLQKHLEKAKDYRVLNVGVRHLPETLSPATAFVDAEKLALDLLFESLVRQVPDPVVGQRYEPLLAAASQQQPLGRQFDLVRDAYWYGETADGKIIKEPVQATDVAQTVLAYKNSARAAEWQDLLGGIQVESNQSVRLSLQQGYVDPLALMTFRVVPERYAAQPNDRAFARRPIGSGPYHYVGQGEGRERPFARFLLNPTYGQRAGKREPAIREIRFFAVRDVRTDLGSLGLHLIYDLATQQIDEVRSPQTGVTDVSIVNLKNRRVWFLAVNQRKERWKNENLRKAIALAIDREKILDEVFRVKALPPDGIRTKEASTQPDRTMHHVLTGPYPAGAWAAKDSVLLNLYRPADARGHAKGLRGQSVTLKYPTDLHPGIRRACELIREQVSKETGIDVVLRGVPWRQLHEEVELQHDYELAYYCWDHPDDRYWLWPLFNPKGMAAGGRNFLGSDDAELAELFDRARDRRQFTHVRQLTHLIHQHVNQKLPLIPLWQLDTCIVIRNDVATVPAPRQLDPLRLFSQIDDWRLK